MACWVEGVQPGEGAVAVGLVLAVAQAAGVVELVLPVVGIGVVGNLVVVGAELGDVAELVGGVAVVDERGEAAVAVFGVVDRRGDGGLESVVAAVAVEAGVLGEFFGVVAEAELVVGLVEVAGGEDELGLAVAFEAGAGDDVEDAVGAVADVGGVAAALDLEGIDILGVDLRADVGSDVGVGDFDAVDKPAEFVAAAHVQHVVGHVGAGDVVGDHGEGVGAVGAGGVGDVDAVDECGGGDAVDVGGVLRAEDGDGLVDGRDAELKVEDERGVGGEGDGLPEGVEAGSR